MVAVLRDTGCNGVIIRRDLVSQKEPTENEGYMMTVDRTLKKAPKARIKVDTPYFVGEVDALCLSETLFDLIIGNTRGARSLNDSDPNWRIVAATITRAQVQKGMQKPLKVKEVTSRYSVTKEELFRMQNEDLKPFTEQKKTVKRGEFAVKFEKHRGILHQIRHRSDGLVETEKQIMVPKSLRHRVMEVTHDSMFGGHLGTKKMKDQIQTNFYWPGMHQDLPFFTFGSSSNFVYF